MKKNKWQWKKLKNMDGSVSMSVITDIFCILISYGLALWMRYDFLFNRIGSDHRSGFLIVFPCFTVIILLVFRAFHLYQEILSQAGVAVLRRLIQSFGVILVLQIAFVLIEEHFFSLRLLPLSVYGGGFLLTFFLISIKRYIYRFFYALHARRVAEENESEITDRIMLIGAGRGGRSVMESMIGNDHLRHTRICCIIDDDPEKQGKYLMDVPIIGGMEQLIRAAEQFHITRIIFAIPSASAADRKKYLNICKETHCKMQIVPGVYQMINGEVTIGKIRNVEITDLLGRDPINIVQETLTDFLRGKTILVTGGGGSIGSELCRQIAANQPGSLIIFDMCENNACRLQQELVRLYPDLHLTVLIGSVRDRKRLDDVMQTYHPDLIYHAAAHKHVPLMEGSANEAIKNNVIGTWNTAQAAVAAGVRKFVLISTDKAVNPTNIMGASKRLCEMIVQMMGRKQKTTDFAAVRFGNVLGSNGSVIPLFKRQIARGGPVTVTHPDIIRYFMTIPEAASLVLEASRSAKGGEIFVLDMGEPVKIDDMARNMIRLSGYTPDVDIKIRYVGLRPGEKLYEELLMSEEGLRKTDHKLIYVARPISMDDAAFEAALHELAESSRHNSPKIREQVARVVKTYHPDLGGSQ